MAHDTPLSRDEIIEINSLGPFNHSVWNGRGVRVSHEEKLTGRVEFLSASLRRELLRRFTHAQLADMTVFDVGCFDGWLLESLSDLPFRSMVGFEPRSENIRKGRKIREILRIPSRVEYVQADACGIGGRTCDILICLGVLHHVSSVFETIRCLAATRPRLIILESLVTPSPFITEALVRGTEPKDVVYKRTAPKVGLSAFKFETITYPGSAATDTVVEVPTRETIEMALDVWGYSKVQAPISDSDYLSSMPLNDRPMHASIVFAEKGASIFETDHALQEETDFVSNALPDAMIAVFRKNIAQVDAYPAGFEVPQVNEAALAPAQRAILGTIRFSPRDKLKLEIAKGLAAKGRAEEACGWLMEIVTAVNPDWRSCYRAFYLLSQFGPVASRPVFRERCETCNPNFPKMLLSMPSQKLLTALAASVKTNEACTVSMPLAVQS